LRSEGQHSQHLLWSMNCNRLIRNILGLRICGVFGEIRMLLVLGGAPFAMKCRSMYRSTSVRNSKAFQTVSYTHSFFRLVRPFKFSILLILFLWRYKWVKWMACSKLSIFVKQLFCKYITVKFLQCEISPWKCKTTHKFIFNSTALLWI
jgi:hypothetical protein